MKDDKKTEMNQQYADLVWVQKRLRDLVATTGVEVSLEPDAPEPSNIEQIADFMNVVRTNATRMESALNAWDRHKNGCELRTNEEILMDIQKDQKILMASELPPGRSRGDIEGNIAYDKMQIRRA